MDRECVVFTATTRAGRRLVCSAAALLLLALVNACSSSGGAGGGTPTPFPPATTKVNLVFSSDANDQLAAFTAQIQSVTLADASGKTVTLYENPLSLEFMHLNGLGGPLATATVERGTYTSATVSVGATSFSCDFIDASGGLRNATFAYGYTPAGSVTVTLPQPISVDGDAMGIALRLLVSQSATASSCTANAPTELGITAFSITPTFELTAVPATATLATEQYLSVREYSGKIEVFDAAVGTGQLEIPAAVQELSNPSTQLPFTLGTDTVLQGVANTAALAPGMFVTLDGVLQANGSVRSTRIAVADPLALNVRRGPVILVPSSVPTVEMQPVQGQGADLIAVAETFDVANASFHISGELSNLTELPFMPLFTAATVVPGQNIYVSAPRYLTNAGQPYLATATTITLMPQTIDGIVYGVTSSGNFTVYSIELGPQDLFASMAVQQGQTTLIAQPSQVQVYVDSNTQKFATAAPVVGAPARFYGLVFNDDGVLRMDAAAILDGLAP